MTRRFDPERLAAIDRRMTQWVESGAYAGAEWRIGDLAGAVHDGRAGAMAFGGEALPAAPLYRIYSMTKPIVTLAAMRLVEEGRLHLWHEVARYLPEFASLSVLDGGGAARPAAGAMTIHHLMTHMAGLSYGFMSDPAALAYNEAGVHADGAVSLREEARRIAGIPLVSDPGAAWRYSVATDVLGAVIEAVEERPLGEILGDRVLEPLGMDDTGFAPGAGAAERIMAVYGGADLDAPLDLARPYPHDAPAFARGGHGLFSTLEDYARLCACLLATSLGAAGPRVVGPATLAAMTRNHVPEAASPLTIELAHPEGPGLDGYGFGLGVAVALERGAARLSSPGAYGWSGAAETWFNVDPANGCYVLFMAQNLNWPGASHDLQSMTLAALN